MLDRWCLNMVFNSKQVCIVQCTYWYHWYRLNETNSISKLYPLQIFIFWVTYILLWKSSCFWVSFSTSQQRIKLVTNLERIHMYSLFKLPNHTHILLHQSHLPKAASRSLTQFLYPMTVQCLASQWWSSPPPLIWSMFDCAFTIGTLFVIQATLG